MKLYTNLFTVFFLISLTLISGMKYKEQFALDIAAQPGSTIHNIGTGWLMVSKSDSKFPVKLASISQDGTISWERSFAFESVAFLPQSGGAMLLDENGNFFRIDRTGNIENSLSRIVEPGRNVLSKSDTGLLYATSADNSITCFMPDGNIEWIYMGTDSVMNIYPTGSDILASENSGNLVHIDGEGNAVWSLNIGGFSAGNPITLNDGFLYGIRDITGKQGSVVKVSPDGKIIWQTKTGYGVNEVYAVNDGFLSVGSNHVTSFDSEGKLLWGQSFEGSRKLVTLGFNDDSRLVLGLLNQGDSADNFKITLLDQAGSIAVVTSIPVKKNQFQTASRLGNKILISDSQKTYVYKLLTMQEYLESKN